MMKIKKKLICHSIFKYHRKYLVMPKQSRFWVYSGWRVFVGVHAATETELLDWELVLEVVGLLPAILPVQQKRILLLRTTLLVLTQDVYRFYLGIVPIWTYNFKKINPEGTCSDDPFDEKTYEGVKPMENTTQWLVSDEFYDVGVLLYRFCGHSWGKVFQRERFLKHFTRVFIMLLEGMKILDMARLPAQIPPDSIVFC